ncbi:conserved hypothetical protein [Perkinsus marinus ATCC 50983]|uniref:ATP-grasp domain-containing protein n=1 Tax=Perkinsus marinus (strain ATCC 50983 / TXsc) TaxID=423536 RepID=C5L9K5_PERM5|nr:conserved hypothetical protein [Perkinsus marinus ATCC 50983]EER06598.1 conserved hypothetical protein [Perkinsus marinus ATCC 50983]|eukprot:XP_002774782.1 conserved hypothetical protein [Perkinsus marinus ATCC 50983]
MKAEFEKAHEVAAHRPRAGTWESPHARPLTAYPSTHELTDFVLDGGFSDPDRGVGLDNPFLAGQFFQTNKLPIGMTSQERAMVAQSLAPTATYEMLAKIPSELVEMETPEGQDLRQRLLRGATVVFFCAGYPGKKFIYQRAAELGVKSVIIDSVESWSKNLVQEGIIAKFIGLDMNQPPKKIFEDSIAGIEALKEDPLVGECDGICTFADLAVPMAARLGEALGLPCLPSIAVDKTRNKYATREAMKAYGMPVVHNYLIKNESQLEKAAEIVGFPAVLKPISGAASLGVKKVDSAADLAATYHELCDLLAGLRVDSGALEQVAETSNSDGDEGSHGVDAHEVISLDMVLEEYLDGDEVDIDVIMDDGKCQFCSVSDNGPTVEPYFNESWAVLPSMLPESKVQELQDMAIDALLSVGISKGLFHVEGKYTSRGPRLVEINARMGGGPVRTIHQHVEGVDLVVEQLFLACGIPSRPQAHEANSAVAYGFALNEKSGVIRDIDFITRREDAPKVIELQPLVEAGEHVVGPEEGMPTWLAVIVVEDETSEKAKEECQRLMGVIAHDCASSLV